MSERKPVHDCPCCTCGMIELRWADRQPFVFADDLPGIAETVVGCALDHYYDRGDGVPYGLSDALTEKLRPIVARHLGAKDPLWGARTVRLTDAERDQLYADVLAAVTETPP